MKNVLLEEIESYRRLSKYNPKLTLTENVELISEAGPNLGSTVRELEGAFGKSIQAIMKDFKIAGMDAARVTQILEKDAKSFEKEWSKALQKDISSGFPEGELGTLGKELSKIEAMRRVTNEVKLKGKPLTTSEMNTIIADVKSSGKLRAAKFGSKASTVKTNQSQTKIKPTPAQTSQAKSLIAKYGNKIKGLDWKRMTKWGAGLGIAVGTLYVIYKLTHGGQEPPIPVTPPTPNPNPTPRERTTSNSVYRMCAETFPIAQFCKNETVKKLQGCLNITADGKFGPKTQLSLEGKGLPGNQITQDTLTKACSSNSIVDADVENIDGEDPNNI